MKNSLTVYQKTGIIALLVGLVLVVIDQLTKQWAINELLSIGSTAVIPGILNFTFVRNSGAAFGILQGKTLLLGIVSTLFLILIAYGILSNRVKNRFMIWCLSFIIAGGAGNIIDRFFRGYVVDFIDLDFSLLRSFPVFNFADICVSVGAFSLIIYLIFFGKDIEKLSHESTEQNSLNMDNDTKEVVE